MIKKEWLTFLFILVGCVGSQQNREEIFKACDNGILEPLKREKYTKSISYWLEGKSQEEFFTKKTSVWREAKGWYEPIRRISEDSLIHCLSDNYEELFLYIPNKYQLQIPIGWEYIKFFLINNSKDTLKIPSYDSVVLNLKTEISAKSDKNSLEWYYLQLPDSVFEDNIGYWEQILLPGTFMEIQLENDFLGYGDSTLNYRIKLELNEEDLYSNSIPINLSTVQLKSLGL